VIEGPTYTHHVVPRVDAIVPLADVVDEMRRFVAGDGYEVELRDDTLVVLADDDEFVTATFEDTPEPRYVLVSVREFAVIEIAMHLGSLLVMKTHGTQIDPVYGVVTSSTRSRTKLRLLSWIPKLEARARAFVDAGETDDRERTGLLRQLEDYNVVAFGEHRDTFLEHDAPTLAELHTAAQRMFAYYDSPERAAVFREAPPHRIGGGMSLDVVRRGLVAPAGVSAHGWLAALERYVREQAPGVGVHEVVIAEQRVRIFVRDEDDEPRLWDAKLLSRA
jgi:hypothetical protein